jgi:hypothetical protein
MLHSLLRSHATQSFLMGLAGSAAVLILACAMPGRVSRAEAEAA